MFLKLKAKWSKKAAVEEELYVPEDELEAEAFDPDYEPGPDEPGYVPGHPVLVSDEEEKV